MPGLRGALGRGRKRGRTAHCHRRGHVASRARARESDPGRNLTMGQTEDNRARRIPWKSLGSAAQIRRLIPDRTLTTDVRRRMIYVEVLKILLQSSFIIQIRIRSFLIDEIKLGFVIYFTCVFLRCFWTHVLMWVQRWGRRSKLRLQGGHLRALRCVLRNLPYRRVKQRARQFLCLPLARRIALPHDEEMQRKWVEVSCIQEI